MRKSKPTWHPTPHVPPKFVYDRSKGLCTINGHEIENVLNIKVETKGGEFSTITLTFFGDATIIPYERDENGGIIYPKQ